MTRYNDYEDFALTFARNTESNPFNALYERPAIIDLAGEVAGLRVLDAGCGPGVTAAELVRRRAVVTGVDLSAGLLDVARERLGPEVPLRQADLAQPLPFADDSFDLVLSSLVMHYLEDWTPTLREFHRVLVPGGRFVMSTHHPFTDMRTSGSDDYFGTYTFGEDWIRDGRTMRMRFWHRPLRAMVASFAAGGFGLDEIREPEPSPEMVEVAPETYRQLLRSTQFIFFGLTAR